SKLFTNEHNCVACNKGKQHKASYKAITKLDDFVKIIGGTVTFGGGDGKITGKGTIRTSKLNFKNVYYVEELQNFNLFSVSQICDTKNKVLLNRSLQPIKDDSQDV
ncbi:hypothetical protein Tco_0501498, partial [Tanacetum coccineum]